MGTTDQAPRYREIERLGAGGMATVTLAEDTLLGREVALKRVYGTGDPHGSLRLKREALVGASLNHPNLVSVYDAETEDDGDVVIVMEYVEGETLSDLLRARGRMRQRRPCGCSTGSPPPWTRFTRAGSCTATSSQPTSCSDTRAP